MGSATGMKDWDGIGDWDWIGSRNGVPGWDTGLGLPEALMGSEQRAANGNWRCRGLSTTDSGRDGGVGSETGMGDRDGMRDRDGELGWHRVTGRGTEMWYWDGELGWGFTGCCNAFQNRGQRAGKGRVDCSAPRTAAGMRAGGGKENRDGGPGWGAGMGEPGWGTGMGSRDGELGWGTGMGEPGWGTGMGGRDGEPGWGNRDGGTGMGGRDGGPGWGAEMRIRDSKGFSTTIIGEMGTPGGGRGHWERWGHCERAGVRDGSPGAGNRNGDWRQEAWN